MEEERTTAKKETAVKLTLLCETEGAEFYVDGKHVGTSGWVGTVSAGKHTAEARKGGFEAYAVTFEADGGGMVNCILPALHPSAPKGHEYVDLGLSVKWATCNIGASEPSDFGNYYAWGETTPKGEYTEGNSKTFGDSSYNHDIGGDPSLDAARANWGGSWRMPTQAECRELINNCTWTWTSRGDRNGYEVTSKKNGKSIFLPAAGSRYGSSLYSAGGGGRYWTSSPYESYPGSARGLYFGSSNHDVDWTYRDRGRSIRPVTE